MRASASLPTIDSLSTEEVCPKKSIRVIAASIFLGTLLAGITGTTIGLIDATKARRKADESAIAAGKQRTKAILAAERTREVLDAMVSEVTGDSLATQKQLSEEQKTFLNKVLDYYNEIVADDFQSRI